MLVYLSELKTGSVYNGIARSRADLDVLVRNFIQSIKIKYGISESNMVIRIN